MINAVRLPYLEIEKLSRQMNVGSAIARATADSTSSYPVAMSPYKPHVVNSGTSLAGVVYAFVDTRALEAATTAVMRDFFLTNANTTPIRALMTASLSDPWIEWYRSRTQFRKNSKAISLVRSWLEEAKTKDAEESKDFEKMKAELDESRPSVRKLFP